jgi:hypothetical protein
MIGTIWKGYSCQGTVGVYVFQGLQEILNYTSSSFDHFPNSFLVFIK